MVFFSLFDFPPVSLYITGQEQSKLAVFVARKTDSPRIAERKQKFL